MGEKREVLVIGGGASGLVAAIVAARGGARVRLVERMARVGKKLLATGNGRCNLANMRLVDDAYHGAPREFVSGVFAQFGVEETLRFFEGIGIELIEEDERRVFPLCGQASAVLDALRYEAEDLDVETVGNAKVGEVVRSGDRLKCVCTDGQAFEADRVVVAAGGKSTPNMGSNGGGFQIAERMGHRVIEPFPALVQVDVDGWFLKRLKGLKVDARVSVTVDGEEVRSGAGEVLFAEYGLSGLPVLHVSRVVSECLNTSGGSGREVTLSLDLCAGVSAAEMLALIVRRIAARPDVSVERSFLGLLHKRLIPVVLQVAGVEDLQQRCVKLGDAGVRRIVEVLKGWRMVCTGTESWMSSQVTAGGVDTSEVDSRTLESQVMPGVFFAGEVLDVDGDSGGYNLQWAWSSGAVAGRAAAL